MNETTTDVVIVGGGIIGLSAAYRLRQHGVRVTLLERMQCGREASWAAAGMLNPPNPHRRGPMQALMRRSLSLYPAFCAELHDLTDIDPEYEVCGGLEVLDTDQRYRMAASKERAATDQLMPDGAPVFRVLDLPQAKMVAPALREDGILGALHVASAAQVRPPRLLQALVTACRLVGVEVCEGCPVADLSWQGDRVDGVETAAGKFRAGYTVLCAGAWSAAVAGRMARQVPVCPVRGQIVLLSLPERRFTSFIELGRTYLVPRRDGLVLLGTTEEHDSGFEKRNTPAATQTLMEAALRLVPSLADAGVVALWSGLRPGTPDRRPCIGIVPETRGLIAATGHFRSGIALAPLTAGIVVDLVTTGATEHDLSLCQPGRRSVVEHG